MIYFNLSYLAVFAFSALICALLIMTKQYHIRSQGADVGAVQAAHKVPTPRIGGVAIFTGLVVAAFLVPSDVQGTYIPLVISMLPVLAAGLAEDLGYDVSPRRRLVAAALSSVFAAVLLGAWVARVDVPGVDYLLTFAPLAILFTAFATAGVCNAFNLIDGVNGLSAGTGVVTAIGLASIAHISGLPQIATICFILIAALMGFLVFNFPWGKIFLGDAGAYSLGHVLAWLSVILMFKVPSLTPWAVVLVFFWPLADTFFAIWRRRRSGRPTDQPDRLHFHQLAMRLLEIKMLGRGQRQIANPVATLVMLPFVSAPVVAGVLFWDSAVLAFGTFVVFLILFITSYYLGVRLATRRGRGVSGMVHSASRSIPAE